jgi:hypothetical protein
VAHEQWYRMAAGMAKNGASHGMIVRKLVDGNVDSTWANQIADEAIRNVANRKRMSGFILLLMGMGLFVVTICCQWGNGPRLPFSLAMTGMLIAGIGFAKIVHRSRLMPRNGADDKRIR